MKTAREALEWIKTTCEGPGGAMMIPMMVDYLTKHFEEGKGIDDLLEME